MTSSQRSFVQRLNRRTAGELRRDISSSKFTNSSELPRSISGSSINSLSAIPSMELVEPPEFEDLVRQSKPGSEKNSLNLMKEFPLDDLQVELVHRKIRTVVPAIIENEVQDPLVRDVIKQYTSDFTVVNKRYMKSSNQHWELSFLRGGLLRCLPQNEYETDIIDSNAANKLSSEKTMTIASSASDAVRGSWAHSMYDLKNSQADPLLPHLLDRIPMEEVDKNNDIDRQTGRQDALYVLLPQQTEEEMIERRQTAVVPSEHFGHQMLLRIQQLKLDLEIEPIFASIALYDVKEKKKISETFHFDLNPPYIKKLLSNHVPREDQSTLSKSCILSVTYPTSDIFLVIRLEKVLQQGDISEVADPYMRDSRDDKVREKARETAWAYCERLGKYRMPLAWAAVNLQTAIFGQCIGERETEKEHGRADSLDRRISGLAGQFDSFRKKSRDDSYLPGGSTDKRGGQDKRSSWSSDEVAAMMDSFKPVPITLNQFYKQESDRLRDEDLFKFLQDMKRASSSLLKKLKLIPGVLKLEISPCPEILPYCLSPELVPLDPYPDKNGWPVKELVEFPQRDVYKPFTHYRNLLYIYPRNLNFNNRQGTARNIAVKVQFMSSEDVTGAQPAIFGKSSGPEMISEAYSVVTYHCKTPDFYDEIKIKLPPLLHNGHHLLFTFYQVSCQRKPETHQQPTEIPLGYSWLPLLRDGRLATGSFALPVAVDHPGPNYSMLPPDVQLGSLANVKWVDNKKPIFDVSMHAVSTVHTLDQQIDHFLLMAHAAMEQKVPPRIGEMNFEAELKRSIADLEKAEGGALVHFLPLILDKLLQLMIQSVIINGQVVSLGQSVFEIISLIVKRVMNLVEDQNDRHGRNALLTAYIDYMCRVPYLSGGTTPQQATTPTGPGSFTVLARPASVPGSRTLHYLSSSDPDLPGSCPESPDEPPISSLASNERSSNTRRTSFAPSAGSPHKPVHEELAYQWVVSSGSTRDHALANAWFFFELIVKTMTQQLGYYRKLATSRRSRFSKQFVDDVTELVTRITKDIAEQYFSDTAITRGLNTSLAFFVRDLLSLMDRGYVFKLIHNYFKTVAKRVTPDSSCASLLYALKIDFLRIVCSHEHLITLNLPLAPLPLTPSSPSGSMSSSVSMLSTTSLAEQGIYIDLTTEHRARHFLIGLALAALSSSLEIKDQNSPHPARAVSLVHNLLASIDLDPRYQDREIKSQVALLFMPLIGITLGSLAQMFDPRIDEIAPIFTSDIPMEEDERERSPPPYTDRSSSTYGTLPRRFGGDSGEKSFTLPGRIRLSSEATRNLLACFLWVLKNVERKILNVWLSGASYLKITQLLEAVYLVIANFEYKGKSLSQQFSHQRLRKNVDTRSRLEEAILGATSARSDMIARRQMSPVTTTTNTGSSSGDLNKLRWRKDRSQWKKSSDSDRSSVTEAETQLEGCLATEAVLITVDVMELIVQVVQSSDPMQGILEIVLRVILFALSLNESATSLRHLFATQRSLVAKFPELLFEETTELCADLCLRLLHHCSSPIAAIRLQASGSLYLLMRQNFEIGNNFARVKMQVTMSLSQLVGQSPNFGEEFLRRSLKTILTYAEADSELRDTSFPAQVQDLVFNLHMILSDTVKMKEYQEDPEMLVDLMYRIAKGYQNSPDLRLTWLQNMAAKHAEKGNHAEAAHCLVHAAGLVAEYLNMLEDKTYMPIGCVALQHVSLNVLEESAVSDDVLSPDEEGICTGKYFTESGLVGLLEQAASSFTMACMYECINGVFRVLVPIYEANHDFKRLHILHSKLAEAFQTIIRQEGKRVFGTYFRVGFYGDKFGILNGHEYIYKEPAITKLPEISHRLESFYTDKFGLGVVVMIKDSNTVERDKMDPTKAYIQITYVEPYFDLYELQHRVTFFEKNYCIKRFMYATPFTQSGRAHGDLREQYKRKTVLTTTHFFPYIKTRLEVIQRDQVILSPIEVAIEDIQKKTKELAVALSQEPPDVKILQMVLQGCIGTTVNQGPLEIALVFLKPVIDGAEPPTHHHNKLRISFKNFLKKCRDALERNRTLITPDQQEYQRELQRNYDKVQQSLAPMISTQLGQMTASTKKKHKKDRASSDSPKMAHVNSDTSTA